MIKITLIRRIYEPYEMDYYRECDKTEKLQREIFHLEEERDVALEDALCWKTLYLKKPLYEKVDDKESIVCAISKLQLMLEELEDQM